MSQPTDTLSYRVIEAIRECALPLGWMVSPVPTHDTKAQFVALPWTDIAESESDFLIAIQAAVLTQMRRECYVTSIPEIMATSASTYTLTFANHEHVTIATQSYDEALVRPA